MKKIISITGAKNSGKLNLAMDLAENSDVEFITPYTDREIPIHELAEKYGDYHYVSKGTLDLMIKSEKVISSTTIDGDRFIFFEFQLTDGYNLLILDDYALADLRTNYKCKLYSIKVWSKKQENSDRVGVYLYNHEFDAVFEYGIDNVEELEWSIENDLESKR